MSRAGGPACMRLVGQRPPVLALVVLAVLAGPDRAPPPLVVAVPGDGLAEPVVELHPRLPAELRPDLLGRQRVAAVVTRAVGHVLDQGLVAARQLDDALDDVDVLVLARAADVVDLAGAAALERRVDRAREVLDVEPVADLAAVAVDRQRV